MGLKVTGDPKGLGLELHGDGADREGQHGEHLAMGMASSLFTTCRQHTAWPEEMLSKCILIT